MAWIELHQATIRHPKIARVAVTLHVSRHTVVGHLASLWCWALDAKPAGGPLDPLDVALGAEWTEEGDFAAALEAAGLLDRRDDGLWIHDWQDYAGRLLDNRAFHAQRQKLLRDTALTNAIKDRDQGRCRYCTAPVDWRDRRGALGATYDHIDPRGPNTFENVVVACRSCNSKKGGRTPEDAHMRLLPAPIKRRPTDRVEQESPANTQEHDEPTPTRVDNPLYLTQPNRTEQDQITGVALRAMTADEERRLRRLHDRIHRDVFGGVDSAPPGWGEDLIRRGATDDDVDATVLALRPTSGQRRGLAYGLATLRRRVEEREANGGRLAGETAPGAGARTPGGAGGRGGGAGTRGAGGGNGGNARGGGGGGRGAAGAPRPIAGDGFAGVRRVGHASSPSEAAAAVRG